MKHERMFSIDTRCNVCSPLQTVGVYPLQDEIIYCEFAESVLNSFSDDESKSLEGEGQRQRWEWKQTLQLSLFGTVGGRS